MEHISTNEAHRKTNENNHNHVISLGSRVWGSEPTNHSDEDQDDEVHRDAEAQIVE